MTDAQTRLEYMALLNEVFCSVFDDDDIAITEETTADNIKEWDSMMHITLVISVEQKFNMRMKAAEVGKLANVGALIDILIERASS